MNNKFLYFAFGHNTNDEDFLRRCPNAKKIGQAIVPNFEVVIRNHADLIQKDGEKAYGVLWAINKGDENNLDYDEKFGENYTHDIVEVLFHGKLYKSMTYVMIPNADQMTPPDKDYIDTIVKGYKKNHVPLKQIYRALKSRINKLKLEIA